MVERTRAVLVTFCKHCNGLIELELIQEPQGAEWTAPVVGGKLAEWIVEWVSPPFPVRNATYPAYAVFVDTSHDPHCTKAMPPPP